MNNKSKFLLFVILLQLTACLNYNQITTLKIDGSGEMFIHYWMKYTSFGNTELIEQIGLFNPDSIRNEFESAQTKIEYIETYKDPADSTIHGKVKFQFNNIDSLDFLEPFSNANFEFDTSDEDTIFFSQDIQPMTTGFGFDDNNLILEYIYYIPGDVVEHNANDLNNNKLTWTIEAAKIGSGTKIFAKFIPYKLKETPVWIYYLALLVLFIVLFYMFKRKRS